jgi:hypothetical protein
MTSIESPHGPSIIAGLQFVAEAIAADVCVDTIDSPWTIRDMILEL